MLVTGGQFKSPLCPAKHWRWLEVLYLDEVDDAAAAVPLRGSLSDVAGLTAAAEGGVLRDAAVPPPEAAADDSFVAVGLVAAATRSRSAVVLLFVDGDDRNGRPDMATL